MTGMRWCALAALATGCGPMLVRDVTLDGQDLVIEKCRFSPGISDGDCTTTRQRVPIISSPFVGPPPDPRAELVSELAGARDALVRCAQQHDVHGVVKVQVTIDGAGRATSAAVDPGDSTFATCVLGTLDGIVFPAPQPGAPPAFTFRAPDAANPIVAPATKAL